MARFRGTIQGGRGEASRLGHTNSGLKLFANSWQGSVLVELFAQGEDDWAYVRVNLGDGKQLCVYHGPLRQYKDPRGSVIPLGITDPA